MIRRHDFGPNVESKMFAVILCATGVTLAGVVVPGTASAKSGAPSCTPTITDGKNVLHHPTVTLIFWGSGWSNNSLSIGNVIGQVQDMLNGPYFSIINQYDNIRIPRLVAQAPWVTATSPSGGFHEGALVNAIAIAIGNGSVPPPTPISGTQTFDNMYVVFTPDGVVDLDHTDSNGRHDNAVTSGGVRFPWAWVSDTLRGSYSEVFGHEVAETATDPFPPPGVTISNCGNDNEIGDICGNVKEMQDGYTVQGLWSVADNACIIPESYSAIFELNGNTFSSVSNPAQKVYPGFLAGSPVLVATNTSDNVFIATGSPPMWRQQIGGPGGAMFAVGNDSVYSLAQDGSAVFRWNGLGNGGTTWTNIGRPAGQTLTGVFGGGFPAVTDTFGQVWTFSASTGQWSLVAGENNEVCEIAGNGVSLNLASKNYTAVFQFQGNGLTSLGTGTAELITGGGNNTILAAPLFLGSSTDVRVFQGTSVGWPGVGSPSFPIDSYAIGGSSLFALSGDHTTVAKANNPNVSNAGWTNVGGGGTFSRLYGQGSTLFAAGSIVF